MSQINRFPHVYTEGDTLPGIVMTLDETDLTGYTVELVIRRPDNSELVKVATFIDATQGKFEFSWIATDLQEGFGQLTAVRFTIGGEVEHTEQLILDVRRAP